MSVASELDVDMQDLLRQVDSHRMEYTDGTVIDMRSDLQAALLAIGWLPPTFTDAVKREVKRAWETDDGAESFRALGAAAAVLGVQLVDPSAESVNTAGRGLREVA